MKTKKAAVRKSTKGQRPKHARLRVSSEPMFEAPLSARLIHVTPEEASHELVKMIAGLTLAALGLYAGYLLCGGAVRAADAAVTRLAGRPGITFEPGFETAPPLHSVSSRELESWLEKYAKLYRVDPGTLRGIFTVESRWNPNAVNPKSGARGIGQFTPDTVRRFRIPAHELHHPERSIENAAYVLRTKIDEQRGDELEAVQSYFCGRSRRDCINRPLGLQYAAKVAQAYGSRPPAPRMVEAKVFAGDGAGRKAAPRG